MNNAVPCAQGQWIAVLDADDRYDPRRLERLVAIGDRTEADMVADNQVIHDAVANADVGLAWPSGRLDWDSPWELTLDAYMQGSDVYQSFNFGMLKPLMRREFVRTTGLAYDKRARYGEDFLYLLQSFVRGGRAMICSNPYYIYTQPFGTLSREWSHASRQRYDFHQVYELNQHYLREYAPVLTPWQRRWLAERGRRLLALENYFRAKELWQSRDLLALCQRLALPPFVLDYAARRLVRRCLGQSLAPLNEWK
jgi:succinoglycan biosynthesis protein ExoO